MAYQYKPSERKLVEASKEIDEYYAAMKRFVARVHRFADKLGVVMPEDFGIATAQKYSSMTTCFDTVCTKGHPLRLRVYDLFGCRRKYYCQQCGREAKGNRKVDPEARAVFEARCDEQGFDIVKLESLHDKVTIRDRRTGETHETWPVQLERWPYKGREVRIVRHPSGVVFVFKGKLPPLVFDPVLGEVVSNGSVHLVPGHSVEKTIAELLDEGYKVANRFNNPSHVEDYTYTWGNLKEEINGT